MNMKLNFLYYRITNFEKRQQCQRNNARACFWENKSFRCKFGNMFRSHFEEKVTLLKFMHYKPRVFAKSVIFHYLR